MIPSTHNLIRRTLTAGDSLSSARSSNPRSIATNADSIKRVMLSCLPPGQQQQAQQAWAAVCNPELSYAERVSAYNSLRELCSSMPSNPVSFDIQGDPQTNTIAFSVGIAGAVDAPLTLFDMPCQQLDGGGFDLHRAQLQGLDFSLLDLRQVNLRLADVSGSEFLRANLEGGDLYGVKAQYANFMGATLTGTELSWIDGYQSNFCGAMLTQAKMRHADLRGATITFAKLCYVSGEYACLSHANLRNSDLTASDFQYAIMFKTDLSFAKLNDAQLQYTILTDAKMTGTQLLRTNFDGVEELNTVDFTDAVRESLPESLPECPPSPLRSANEPAAEC